MACFLIGCASRPLEERNKEELNHHIWSLTLAAPAINSAMGPFNERNMQNFASTLSRRDRQLLISLSTESFHPAKVYQKMSRASLGAGSKKEMLAMAKRLESDSWSRFARNLMWYYGEEGSREVEEVMLALDRDEYELDMQKAVVLERIALQSFNQNVVDILYSKTSMGSPGERFLYKASLFTTTYLAGKDLSLKQLKEIERIRSGKLYKGYKRVFEDVVSAQYDHFIRMLQSVHNSAYR